MVMNIMAQKVNNQAHGVTVDTTIVSITEPLNHSLAARAVTTSQSSFWPLLAIAVASLASVSWSVVLLWLIGCAIW
jgi:hypothetical protein